MRPVRASFCRRYTATVLLVVALIGFASASPLAARALAATPTPSPSGSPSGSPSPGGAVTVAVLDMSPTTPTPSTTPQPITFTLALTNTSDATLNQVRLSGRRDAPINQSKALRDSFSSPRPPSANAPAMHSQPVESLAAKQTRRVSYTATASILDDGSTDICLCFTGIYPIDFLVVASTGTSGTTRQVGFGQTYLPSFPDAPTPIQVSWVWPLIDRPHRVLDGASFIDDELGLSVAPGGRLDRALQVVEQVDTKVRLTLLVDPELISELLAMSGPYTIESTADAAHPNGLSTIAASPTSAPKVQAGAHSADAVAWLARFHAAAAAADVEFTPAADPDTESMVKANLHWNATVDPTVAGQATGMGNHDIVWPADGLASSANLKALVGEGAQTVIVSDAILPPLDADAEPPSALADLPSDLAAGPAVHAVVTDSTLEKLAGTAVSVSDPGAGADHVNTAALPRLVAGIAIQAAAEPDQSHYVALAAPRDVDPQVPVAVRAILETAATSWSTPITMGSAVGTLQPDDRAPLAAPVQQALVDPAMITLSANTSAFATSFATVFANPGDAGKVLGGYPQAAQRSASLGWRGHTGSPVRFAAGLNARTTALSAAVHIIRPTNGTYTLASRDAALFVSVVNDLAYPAKVEVHVAATNGARGLTTEDIGPQTVQGNGTQVTLRIPTHVERSGRFEVEASLTSPDGMALGAPVSLNVRSSAIGIVGVVITVAAGVVLVALVLIRLLRRIRRGGPSQPRPPTPAPKEPALL